VEVPLFARNVAGMLAFQPGVTSFSSFGKPLDNADYRNGSVNGAKPTRRTSLSTART